MMIYLAIQLHLGFNGYIWDERAREELHREQRMLERHEVQAASPERHVGELIADLLQTERERGGGLCVYR